VSHFTPAALATDSTAKLLRAALPQLMQISFGKSANVLLPFEDELSQYRTAFNMASVATIVSVRVYFEAS
jgi:hypothetical protein